MAAQSKLAAYGVDAVPGEALVSHADESGSAASGCVATDGRGRYLESGKSRRMDALEGVSRMHRRLQRMHEGH